MARLPERSDAAPFKFKDGLLTLRLHVQPGAARSGWAGLHGAQALRLRLAAPAVDGKANAACIAFLAQAAGVPKRAVVIVRGERAREKTVRIVGVGTERFQWLRGQWES
jgi:uncharacterized protein (TIGR00251 family)